MTKLKAAQLATAAGVTVVILNTQRIETIDATIVAATAAAVAAAAAAAAAGAAAGSAAEAAPGSVASGAASAAAAAVAGAGGPAPPAPAVAPSTAFIDRGIGTTFLPVARPAIPSRKRWILSLAPEGGLVLDRGAVAAVVDGRKSLFAVGVVHVEGDFEAQDAIAVLTEERVEVARALVNFSSSDCRRLRGKRSSAAEGGSGSGGSGGGGGGGGAGGGGGGTGGGGGGEAFEALCDRDNVVLLVDASLK